MERTPIAPVPLILQVTGLSIVVALLAGHSLYNVFDRYLLMALPAAMLLVALEPSAVSAPYRAWSEHLGWVLVAAVAVFAMLATADSLAWQRARWHVLRQAIAAGITADEIDGGQEFNGVTRGNSFAPATGASYELRFVDSQTPGALCAHVDVWIGPRAGGICLLPVNRTPGTHN